MEKEKSILKMFPTGLREKFIQVAYSHEDLSEIRLRVEQPVIILRRGTEYFLTGDGEEISGERIDGKELFYFRMAEAEALFSYLCQYSPYAHAQALKQGFLTVGGGHRVGMAGQMIQTEDGTGGVKNVRFFNIRISHEIKGVATPYLSYLYGEDKIYNCLIIAPPGLGKTTMLRDLIRQISDGNVYGRGLRTSIVDERSEIAGCFLGQPQNDVGIRSDVLDGCSKAYGMEMMLRSMSPEVIAVDEIALLEDVETLLMLMNCGVRILATIHGESVQEVMEKPFINKLFKTSYFKRFLLIQKKGKAVVYDEKGDVLI